VKRYAKDFSIFILENTIALIRKISVDGTNSCRALRLLCSILSAFNYKCQIYDIFDLVRLYIFLNTMRQLLVCVLFLVHYSETNYFYCRVLLKLVKTYFFKFIQWSTVIGNKC
jgi:hypothetical protein